MDPEHARDLGMLGAKAVVEKKQLVGPQQTKAFYKFELAQSGTLTYGATSLSTNDAVQVLLFRVQPLVNPDLPYDLVTANGADKVTEVELEHGAYYVMAKPYGSGTAIFDLSLSFDVYPYPEPESGDPGGDKDSAYDLGPVTALKKIGGYVGGTDASDFYRFTLDDNSHFQIAFTDIRGYIAIDLYKDAEILSTDKALKRWSSVNVDTYPAEAQPAGVYYLKVYRYSSYHGLYQLSITAKE